MPYPPNEGSDCVSAPAGRDQRTEYDGKEGPADGFSLTRTVLDAGGVLVRGTEGQTAFRWRGRPKAFVLVVSGKLKVNFRTRRRKVPWAECRAIEGQDCMPVTAAILSGRAITVRATCAGPSAWLELSSTSLALLVHGHTDFRRALFAQHARRLPILFARTSTRNTLNLDQRIADWLLGQAVSGEVIATHSEIAADLLTAREVVSRRLKSFAKKGWIMQGRGRILLSAPAALARLARDSFAVCGPYSSV